MSKLRFYTLVEVLVLGLIMGTAASTIAPCHWTAFWLDREFTGWVAPIARRIASGQVLYADGAHSPIAPLPFVLLSVLFGASANWFAESALIVVCQVATLLVLYAILARSLPRPAAFLAVLGTTPLFFSLAKTILYDALSQLMVAVVAALAVLVCTPSRSAHRRIWLGLLALASATAVLSKQNTGIGATAGVFFALILFPANERSAARLRRTIGYGMAVALALVSECAALSRLISVRGLMTDAFLTGSEPKGGSEHLVAYFGTLGAELWTALSAPGMLLVLTLMSVGLVRAYGHRTDERTNGRSWAVLCGAGFLGAATGLAFVLKMLGPPRKAWLDGWPIVGDLPRQLLFFALFNAIILTVATILPGVRRRATADSRIVALSVCVLVTFPAAVCHTLSVQVFRWTYDNNPLIAVALGGLFWGLLEIAQLTSTRLRMALCGALFGLMQYAIWTTARFGDQVAAVQSCTERWPEVAYLAGAWLPPQANDMRELVRIVQTAAVAPDDTVMLLPEDPDVAAWFDRPRPRLSSAIIFVDQYWDRYVDDDFARLQRTLPKVIVIGPRSAGVAFQLYFWHQNTGALRLIQRVQAELLPQHYTRMIEHPVAFSGQRDFMDIYVRRGPVAAPR